MFCSHNFVTLSYYSRTRKGICSYPNRGKMHCIIVITDELVAYCLITEFNCTILEFQCMQNSKYVKIVLSKCPLDLHLKRNINSIGICNQRNWRHQDLRKQEKSLQK